MTHLCASHVTCNSFNAAVLQVENCFSAPGVIPQDRWVRLIVTVDAAQHVMCFYLVPSRLHNSAYRLLSTLLLVSCCRRAFMSCRTIPPAL
jgi:hypothetical protein